MTEWSATHPAHLHRYEAARFGLRADAIRERFAGYISAFDVPLED